MVERKDNKEANKGFTIHVGDTYIGYLTISDKLAGETLERLQAIDGIKMVVAAAELKPYAKEERTNPELQQLLGL